MIQRKGSDSDHNEEGGHFWISISDLMTSLLFIFILILAYTILTFQQKSEADERNRAQREQLLNKIEIELKEKNIIVMIDHEKGSMRLSSENLFEQSRFKLKSDQAKDNIIKIAQTIKKVWAEDSYADSINTIFIEGHTDSDYMNEAYNGPQGAIRIENEELSALRAIEIFKVMNMNENIDKMESAEGKKLFSYSGYAASRPLPGNTNKDSAEKQANRRIEFFFALMPPKVN